MGRKVYFACPTDEDVVLFEEDLDMMKFMLAERPETCHKCGKSYYKWECSQKPEDETSRPGYNRRNP
jgi:NAD-dependent dihydropyrimidine dehydrogenase PreA subunit